VLSDTDQPQSNATWGALEGLTVLELTQMLSGPFAGMCLADQGARVIKVEPPGGDHTRDLGPNPDGGRTMADGGYGGYFASINRNKRSIVIDLKSAGGRDLFLSLVADADVVLENFRAGVMDRLGLGYETLAEVNPKLVYAAIRGFGDPRTGESAQANWPAYDVVAQAMGGIMAITGSEPGGTPTKIGPGVGDLIPAMQSVIGILAAVYRAERTGRGQFVDVAMVDGVMAVCERAIFQHTYTGAIPGPEGNAHPLLCPFGLFPAKDGHVAIGIPRDVFWAIFAEQIGMPELADDPRYRENAGRLERQDEVHEIVGSWTSARSKSEIARVLGGKVPFGPVQSADEIIASDHMQARAMLAPIEHPGVPGRFAIANTPIKMTETPGGVHARAPLVGEHTSEVLAEFGFSDDAIESLMADKVVA